ncbi:MAG TPA: UDP-N-acetylmuramoyl-L-alanyl-D-glutamate--2,6-diaminopimelate ligase [Polyangiaceae bacterium]|nr:UDP-N-acetylmuramoyl-L-alanyl-D-glutamate--2,6-diaminopimelate ligase [Polyangiaceae bacterium]
MGTTARDGAALTAEELHAFERIEAGALSELSAAVSRPTRAPLPWAEKMFTVGVTGTNGKTSTTHLVAAMMRAAGHGVLTESTVGYFLNDQQLDVPRTTRGYVGAMKRAVDAGALHSASEVTSAALGRGFARVWRYDLGVFTNLTRDHVTEHGSWEHYLASKAQLFIHLGPGTTAVLNAADPAALLIEQVTPADVRRRFFAVPSRGQQLRDADLVATSVDVSPDGTRVRLAPSEAAEQLGGELQTAFIGEVFAENLLAAALAGLSMPLPPEAVRRGAREARLVPGRFELVSREPLVAVDFAHTPDALARTADTARALAGNHRVIFVFGAGGGKDKPKRAPMGRAAGERADYVILTSDNPRHDDAGEIAAALASGARRGGRAHVRIELDRARAIRQAIDLAQPGDVVVVSGKGHETGQTIGDVTTPFSDAEQVLMALGRPLATSP